MTTPLGTLHILLVDDNANMRAITTAMLRSLGVGRISEADDGSRAAQILHESQIDIAIVDFKMLPVDGIAFTRLVRDEANSPNPYLPIIMMTGHSDQSRVVEARDAGVNEFVAKPVQINALIKRIEAIILKPRPFVRSETFFGPDRRRTVVLEYAGPFRRSTDPRAA
ncbi:response regulator [uncultured Brevundimonas sp.]|uniref:response regulator n=1 Tax=uncultured Brevundimonas sp. TaxID=213418 RepID=UPI0026273419|nr:response regulator [uncultured Brevundimonas sp.]